MALPRFAALRTSEVLPIRSVQSVIKLHTKCLFSPVTHRVLLSKWPQTLESQEKHARIMPSRSIHLGNPG